MMEWTWFHIISCLYFFNIGIALGYLVADFLVYRRRRRSDIILRKTCIDKIRGIRHSNGLSTAEGEDLDRLAELHGIKREKSK